MAAIPRLRRPCLGAASTIREGEELHALLLSIYGCDALEVPIAFAEVEGMEPAGSLEVLVALAEVEGVEPGGAPVEVVMSCGVCRGFSFGVQAMSSSGRSSIWS